MLKYKITKFDAEHKVVVVHFAEGGWAEIRLTAPFPENIEQLEGIIKRFAAPKEVIEAKNANVDLSYIGYFVEVERECERFSLAESIEPLSESEKLANEKKAEEAAIEQEALMAARIEAVVYKVLQEKGL